LSIKSVAQLEKFIYWFVYCLDIHNARTFAVSVQHFFVDY